MKFDHPSEEIGSEENGDQQSSCEEQSDGNQTDDSHSDANFEPDDEEQEISDFDSDGEISVDGSDEKDVRSEEGSSLGTLDASDQTVEWSDHEWERGLFRSAIYGGNGDATLYFPRVEEEGRTVTAEQARFLRWKVCKFTPHVVRVALRQCGFKLVRGGRRWVGYWGKHCAAERFKHIRPWQKVNHFPTSFEIGRKDKLAWNLKRLRERVGDEGAMDLDFLPETFTLPRARRKLRAVFQSHPVWIVKPPANARGNGIKLINKWSDAPKKKEAVISRYIQNPLLIDHRKFDLRVYVLVTSFEPLRVYIYKEGIARFACDCYPVQLNSKTIKNRFAHLTNFSVARKKNKGEPTKQLGQEKAATKRRRSRRNLEIPVDDDRFSMESCKWSFAILAECFKLNDIDFQTIWSSIRKLVLATIISSHTVFASGVRLHVANPSSCYELFGFDILLDEHLKPWLMEVNISPSLKASCPVDENIKARLVRDIFNLVGFRLSDLRLARAATSIEENTSMSAKKKKEKLKRLWTKPTLASAERQRHRLPRANKITISLNDTGGVAPDIVEMLERLTEVDRRVLQQYENEYSRRGDFERAFPAPRQNLFHWLFQPSSRWHLLPYYDRLLNKWVTFAEQHPQRALNYLTVESEVLALDGSVSLSDTLNQTFSNSVLSPPSISPNPQKQSNRTNEDPHGSRSSSLTTPVNPQIAARSYLEERNHSRPHSARSIVPKTARHSKYTSVYRDSERNIAQARSAHQNSVQHGSAVFWSSSSSLAQPLLEAAMRAGRASKLSSAIGGGMGTRFGGTVSTADASDWFKHNRDPDDHIRPPETLHAQISRRGFVLPKNSGGLGRDIRGQGLRLEEKNSPHLRNSTAMSTMVAHRQAALLMLSQPGAQLRWQ